MKGNRIFLVIMLLLIGSTAVFGAEYGDALDGLDAVGAKGTTIVATFGDMFLTIAGWGLLLGFPVGAYWMGYAFFKKQDERNETSASAAMTHAKAGFTALIGAFVGSMLFIMVFTKLLHLDEAYSTTAGQKASMGTIVKKVLKLAT